MCDVIGEVSRDLIGDAYSTAHLRCQHKPFAVPSIPSTKLDCPAPPLQVEAGGSETGRIHATARPYLRPDAEPLAARGYCRICPSNHNLAWRINVSNEYWGMV
jgi:hypothetical protein